MSAQTGQQEGQVFYDANTGQYYTQPANQGRFFNPVLGFVNNGTANRNYINNFNNQSMTAKPTPQHNYIDIAALFPELYQGAKVMQGDAQVADGLIGNQGAADAASGSTAKAASSGAGRFL